MTTTLSIRVTPGARQEFLEQLPDGTWKMRLRARAIEGQANEAVCEKLATLLKLSRSKVAVMRGEKSRQKIIKIIGLGSEEVQRLLTML